MEKRKYYLFLAGMLAIVGWGPFNYFPTVIPPIKLNSWALNKIKIINSQAHNIDPMVLKLSLAAYLKARQQGLDNKHLLTIIDYSKPSTVRRLWVVDMAKGKVLFNTWVTHGKNSGSLIPTSFSNEPGSLKSSIGVFLTTSQSYFGENGYSLRVVGLEQGINDNAYRRDIVFHGAWYANPKVIKKYGTLGRSWGCPAVSEETVRPLINTIKDDTLVFIYYPDRKWLASSTFLIG